MPDDRTILEEAAETIRARSAEYGGPEESLTDTARMWGNYLGVQLFPNDVALMMILVKVSRLKTGGWHRDSAVDIAGYAHLLEILHDNAVESWNTSADRH